SMDDVDSDAIIIITVVFLFFSLVAVSLRCFVRLKVVKAFGRDDALMVIAMIFNIAFATCGIVGATNGMGKTQAYLAHRPNVARRGLLCWWLGQIFYIFTCTIARLSIAMTLLRLAVERIHSWILYGVMGFSTAVGIVFLFFTIFQCHAVSCFWNRLPTGCHCLSKATLLGIVYMYSGVATVCDFTLGLLPIYMIWKLQMDRQTKFAVSGILGIACMFVLHADFLTFGPSSNTGSSQVRALLSSFESHFYITPVVQISSVSLYQRHFRYTGSNLDSDATYQISIWSNLEASLGITAGCLMTVRPLLRIISHAASSSPSENSPVASVPMLSDRGRNAVFKSRGEHGGSLSSAPTEEFLENSRENPQCDGID
ncbi:hypothetical protein N7510_000846, partial [Penicillium lagena]|uniref:uncharacterized protein n=1 Tax=Penicillium lagena TaxID=94218 RepID=UPI002541950B